MPEYPLYFDERGNLLREPFEIALPSAPTAIRWGEETEVFLLPDYLKTYADQRLIIFDREAVEIRKWLRLARELVRLHDEHVMALLAFVKCKGIPLPKPIAYVSQKNGSPWAYYDIGAKMPLIINAEAVKWLTAEGYRIEHTGVEKPLLLRRKGEYVAGLMVPGVSTITVQEFQIMVLTQTHKSL